LFAPQYYFARLAAVKKLRWISNTLFLQAYYFGTRPAIYKGKERHNNKKSQGGYKNEDHGCL
jgi:hypothetical protein